MWYFLTHRWFGYCLFISRIISRLFISRILKKIFFGLIINFLNLRLFDVISHFFARSVCYRHNSRLSSLGV